jgi:hypothetical protein
VFCFVDIRDRAAKIPFGHMLVNSSAKEKKKSLSQIEQQKQQLFDSHTKFFNWKKKCQEIHSSEAQKRTSRTECVVVSGPANDLLHKGGTKQ